MPAIIIEHKKVFFDNIKDYAFQEVLKNTYRSNLNVKCSYRTDIELPISICKNNGNYYLRNHKYQSEEHREFCYFKYHENRNSSSAIKKDDKGNIDIKISLELSDKKIFNTENSSKRELANSLNNSNYKARNNTSINGLLKYLITIGGLDIYAPDLARNENAILNTLCRTLLSNKDGKRINISGKLAANICYIVNPRSSVNWLPWKKFETEYPFIIGVLDKIEKQNNFAYLYIKGFSFPLTISLEVYYHIYNNFKNSIYISEKYEGFDIVCIQIKRIFCNSNGQPNRYLCFCPAVDNFALLTMDKHGITFDSSYEYHFSQYLKNQKRYFKKPIAAISDTPYSEDFRLLDTNPHTFIEIWGMDIPEYLKQKQKKKEYYEYNNFKLLEWHPKKEKLPTLPVKSAKFIEEYNNS